MFSAILLLLVHFSKYICIHSSGGRNLPGFRNCLFFSPVIFLIRMPVIISSSLACKIRKNLVSLQHDYFKEVLGVLTTSWVLQPRITSSEGKMQVGLGKSELYWTPPPLPRLRSWSSSLLLTCWLSFFFHYFTVGGEAEAHGTSSFCSVKEVCSFGFF